MNHLYEIGNGLRYTMKKKLLIVAVSLLIQMLLAGCATLSNDEAKGYVVKGRVTDVDTGKPLPNVLIVQWWGTILKVRSEVLKAEPGYKFIDNTSRSCATAQMTRSDAEGRFKFLRPNELFDFPAKVDELSYKELIAVHDVLLPGYEQTSRGFVPEDKKPVGYWDNTQIVVSLRRHRTRDEALDAFANHRGFDECYAGQGIAVEKVRAEFEEETFRRLVEMRVTPDELADALARRAEKIRAKVTHPRPEPYTREEMFGSGSQPDRLRETYKKLGVKP